MDTANTTGDPWLLNVSYTAPHWPYPNNWTYYEYLAHLDDEIGRLLEGVDRSNTFIWFQSDHGSASTETDENGSNYPFEGGKATYLEGGIRAVCGVSDPYSAMPETIDYRTSNFDLVPTLKRVAHVIPDGGLEFDCSPGGDGYDILSPVQRDIAYYEERTLGRTQLACLITDTHKLRVEIRPWSFEDNPDIVFQSWLSTLDDQPLNDPTLEAAMLQRLLDETPLTLPYET